MTHLRSRSKPARPYIWRLIILILLTARWPAGVSRAARRRSPTPRCDAWATVNEILTSSGWAGSASLPARILRCQNRPGTAFPCGAQMPMSAGSATVKLAMMADSVT